MTFPKPVPTLLFLISLLIAPSSLAADDRAGIAFFEAKIRPVLIEHCFKCHSAQTAKPKAGLLLDTREALRRGGDSGPPLDTAKPDESLLLQAIAHADNVAPMPPKRKLSEAVVADFRHWIALGAPDPRDKTSDPSAPTNPLDWWSLKPLTLPPVPPGAQSPIDGFIEARLHAKGLIPGPQADPRTLIRRLTFDLTGLPPTPPEVEAFLADQRPDAYERVVDRLLASPHYGERWARHWMDLVHFAETHGHDQDRIRPNAWKYRDYLIDAFNRDMTYPRFVQEQLAADILFPDAPSLTPALGFLAAGPWDESSLRDIREDSIDRKIGQYLDRDDVVTTVVSTFLSTTVHCARCHDHKFDPIPQTDYYNLQSVFAGIDRADRPYDPDPAIARKRTHLTNTLQKLRTLDPALLASLLDPALQSEVAAWESKQKATLPPPWTILHPEHIESSGGATLAIEPDNSVIASGTRPSQETYTISALSPLPQITAIRLELLSDDRLPHRGPGRTDNGNLHLTEFQLLASEATASRQVPLRSASADFNQEGWNIAAAIDGNDQTAWGIYPQVGKPHQAVFELAEPLVSAQPATLTFILRQTFPVGHPIGRLRLSVTSAPPPINVSTFPDPIASILRIDPDQRTSDQRLEVAAYYLNITLETQLAALPPSQFVYAGASQFAPDGSHRPAGRPRPVFLLSRGDIHQPGPEAHPGALLCVPALQAKFDLPDPLDEGVRRALLAKWITHPDNPLAWRSIANRVWQHHFGRGLVDTPNDFGRMGSAPTHPDLLDWLALELRDHGGSLKNLHRQIVNSDAYRRSTLHNPKATGLDADNHLLWRQNRLRLDAESVRDAILLASARLDFAMHGPSIRHFDLSPGVHVTPVINYDKYDWNAPSANRRGVYRFLFRTLPDPFMDTLDAADASQLTPARNESVTPLLALAMLNDRFVLRQSERLACRLEAEPSEIAQKINSLFLLVLSRPPNLLERLDWSAYAQKHGLAATVRLLWNSNEFLFVN